MLKIKLKPVGKKGRKSFRVVVDPARSKLNSRFIADLGFYNPQTKELKIDKIALKDWQNKGAQLTIGVDKLLNPDQYQDLAKKKKANRLARRQKGKEQPAQPKKEDVKSTDTPKSDQEKTDANVGEIQESPKSPEEPKKEIKPETKNEPA